MINYDEMRATLDNSANAIHQMDPNPSTWLAWIVYLLDQLDQKSKDSHPANQQLYRDMLVTLMDRIRTRLKTGGW